MHADLGTYTGACASQAFDILKEHKADVHATLQNVAGMFSDWLSTCSSAAKSIAA